MEAVLRIISKLKAIDPHSHAYLAAHLMPNVAARVLFLYKTAMNYVTRNGYVHLAPKMRDNDTRHIKEYVPLVVTETQSDRGVIEEQPALLKHQ